MLIFIQNTWLITAYMVANGLSWWQSWLCVWIGNLIASYLIYLMGRIGAEYHIPFPVLARAPFGTRGSLGPVFSTIIMGSLWYERCKVSSIFATLTHKSGTASKHGWGVNASL